MRSASAAVTYGQAVAETASRRSFAARYAHERLAILDGDIDELVRLLVEK